MYFSKFIYLGINGSLFLNQELYSFSFIIIFSYDLMKLSIFIIIICRKIISYIFLSYSFLIIMSQLMAKPTSSILSLEFRKEIH